MRITILCVGKIKESYWKDAIKEYEKRLSKYCQLKIIEVADEKTPDSYSLKEEKEIRRKEGERLKKHLDSSGRKIALAIQGQHKDSLKFAKNIDMLGIGGISHIQFIIGGSLGLSEEILRECDELLSFSSMTFPHQMMRVILLEQIYRAYRIIKNEPYHK